MDLRDLQNHCILFLFTREYLLFTQHPSFFRTGYMCLITHPQTLNTGWPDGYYPTKVRQHHKTFFPHGNIKILMLQHF